VKTGQSGDGRELEPRELLLDESERIARLFVAGGVRAVTQHSIRLRTDEAIAGQPLAALHALQ